MDEGQLGSGGGGPVPSAGAGEEVAPSLGNSMAVAGGIRLNLGCGKKLWPGFVNIDRPGNWSEVKPDIECDITKLPYEKGTVDEIHAIHVIEHFKRWELETVIRYWTGLLVPGGKLVLECPCLEKVMALLGLTMQKPRSEFTEDERTTWISAMLGLYGDYAYGEGMNHLWCYSQQELGWAMLTNGCEDIRIEKPLFHRPVRDMRIVGIKGK